MFRIKSLMTSALIFVMAMANFVHAANQNYIVSFVAGRPGLGLVTVTKTDTEIQAGPASITPMGITMGSTALDRPFFGWDGDIIFSVYATYAGDTVTPIKTGHFSVDSQLKIFHQEEIPGITPKQYHPLHLFQIGGGTRFLAAGPFGTSDANNYVSYSRSGNNMKNIFVNASHRSLGTAAAAPDGGLVSQMTFTGLNHVGLDGKLKNGSLAEPSFQWLNGNDFQGYSQSLSNPIQSASFGSVAPKTGTRYLAYRNFKQPRTVHRKSQVVIQNVDATTGQPQGSPRAITNFAKAMNVAAERIQSIAISPDGGLILYTAWNNNCKKQVLVARSLANGSRVGKLKVVVGCEQLEEYPVGVYGINIATIPQ